MSSSIEDQIVAMKFDNRQFETGVKTSTSTLDKLKTSLQFKDTGSGLNNINNSVRGFNLNPMSDAIQGISKGWLALTTVAVTAISNITNKVVDSGIRMAKSFTIDPITQGFHEYETTLNSVQTIMANTGANVKTVNKYLNDLNHYSDKTIYNFTEMAKNIGTFTAAGVDLKTATASIKGIANLAAVSGSSSEQASTAMYQLSQAIASGKVGLQDWNSVVNAGMGGKVFQTALVRTAQNMGAVDKGAVKLEGPMKKLTINGSSFRDSISAKPGQTAWLTSDVLTSTLKQLSGNMTDGQLKAQGYTKSQREAILSMAKTAQAAATRVKTFSQLIDVVKESIGSGWSKIFQDLFGNFKEASKLWTGVSATITGGVSKVFGSIDKILVGWRKLGGFTDLWTGFGNIFKTIGNLLTPLVDAFKAIFPATGKAGSGLAKATSGFATVTGWMEKASRGAVKIEPVFTAIFGAFKKGASYVAPLLSALKPFVPLLKDLASAVGDLAAQGAQIASGLISGLLGGLSANDMKKAITDWANNIVIWIKDALGIHSPSKEMIPVGEGIATGIAQGIGTGVSAIISALGKVFTAVGHAIKGLVTGMNLSDALAVVNTGFFIAFYLAARKFFTSMSGLVESAKHTFDSVGGVFDQLTNNLKTMQNKVRSEIIRNIAISIAILAASAILLSTVDAKKLGLSLGAIVGMMVTLMLAMRTLAGGSKGMDAKAIAKQTGLMLGMSTAMIAFSTAILILAGAVALLGQLKPKTLTQGLEAVGAMIAGLVAATAIFSKTGGGATILAASAAMLIMSFALLTMAGVLQIYANLDWQTLVQGGGAAAAVIIGIGLAMRTFGKGAVGGSVALLIASAALIILAGALQIIANIGVGNLVKTVIALDIVLGSIAGAANLMTGALPGAAAMIVMSAAIIVLAVALTKLSTLSWTNILSSLVALALVFVVIGAASIVLAPVTPLILALGTALLVLGAAMLLAGVGMLAFATGIALLATVGTAGFLVLGAGVTSLLGLIPLIAQQIGLGIIAIADVISKAGPKLLKAFQTVLGALIDAIIGLLPKVGNLIQKLVKVILRVIVNNQINAAKAMIKFITGMLNAMTDGVPKMVTAGTNLIIAVITGLSKNAVKIANATGKAILSFLNGIDKAVKRYAPQIRQAGLNIAVDLVDGLTGGLLSYGVDKVESAAASLASHIPGPIRKFLGMGSPSKVTHQIGIYTAQGLANGLKSGTSGVEDSAVHVAQKGLEAMKMTFQKSRDSAGKLIDTSPRISPILDLTQLEKDASQIGSSLGNHSIKANLSRSRARDIASDHAARHRKGDDKLAGDTYNFNQEIKSADPINHVKVYRGTKSQIALFKEVTSK